MYRKDDKSMKYEKPIWELIEFEANDVICESGPGGLDKEEGDGDDF